MTASIFTNLATAKKIQKGFIDEKVLSQNRYMFPVKDLL